MGAMLFPALAAAVAGLQPPVVPFPHPLITEVLYAVPTANGDANRDGKRQVAGDEFVELVNPHDRPIRLGGYALSDKNPPERGQFRFVFPAVTLQPGQAAVVFNGCESAWVGAVGDSLRPPHAGNKDFAGALVFTARAANTRVSFANTGDFVLLSAPDGSAVHRVAWGDASDLPALAGAFDERAPGSADGSVQRPDAEASLAPHPLVDGRRFSPGVWGAGPTAPVIDETPPEPAAPDPAPAAPIAAEPEPPAESPLPEFPHPMISEVLFDVPAWADASMDGQPDRTGDEFIEVWNPHAGAVQLGGYRLEVRDKAGQGRLDFEFPNVELPAGGVAVVFNGYRQRLSPPLGDGSRAPAAGHTLFGGALLFTMRNGDARAALDDHDDWVMLRAPDGEGIHAVTWGRPSSPPVGAAMVWEAGPTLPGSVALDPTGPALRSHAELHGVPFSPGEVER